MQIELGQPREFCDVDAGCPSGVPGGIDRRNIIVNHRVRIQREPVPEPRQAIAKIETTVAKSRNVVPIEHIGAARRAGKALPEVAECQRRSPRSGAGEDGVTGKTQLQILGGAKADLLPVKERLPRKLMARELAKEIVVLKGTEELRQEGNIKRCRALDAE